MKIISFNVNGVRAVVKKTFVEDMTSLNADIICLQETKANDAQVAEALQPLSNIYSIFSSSAERPGYSGTAVLSKVKPLNVSYGLGIAEHDTEGRLITCELILLIQKAITTKALATHNAKLTDFRNS